LLTAAALSCPCHLPIYFALLAGTGLAGALSQHLWLTAVALTAIFLISLHFGLKMMKNERSM